jgi:hypothetical protein
MLMEKAGLLEIGMSGEGIISVQDPLSRFQVTSLTWMIEA